MFLSCLYPVGMANSLDATSLGLSDRVRMVQRNSPVSLALLQQLIRHPSIELQFITCL